METHTQVNIQYERKNVHAKLEASYFSQRKKVLYGKIELGMEPEKPTTLLLYHHNNLVV